MFTIAKSLATSLLVGILIASGAPVRSQESRPSREIESVQEVGAIKFELKGCQRQGSKVICSFLITCTTQDTNGFVSDKTRLIDTSGVQYESSSIQNASYYDKRAELVQGVPIRVSATFTKVPTAIQDIALFEITSYFGSSVVDQETFKAQFRNIRITEAKTGKAPSPVKKKK